MSDQHETEDKLVLLYFPGECAKHLDVVVCAHFSIRSRETHVPSLIIHAPTSVMEALARKIAELSSGETIPHWWGVCLRSQLLALFMTAAF